MKGLIIKKEWLDKIIAGQKIWEIRGTTCKLRGDIALIESGSGEIKAIATIVSVHGPFNLKTLQTYTCKHQVSKKILSEWGGYKSNYCWELSNVRALQTPLKYAHPQGAVIWVGEKHLPHAKLTKLVGS